jgi:hypothetical protein
MIARERHLYHQLHPAKLITDWGTAVVAGSFFWWREPVTAMAVGFVPSILVTLTFASGRFDHALEQIRLRPTARAIAPQLSTGINALRFTGLALAWAGCWFHELWLLPVGVLVILGGWWLAWRRGASDLQAPRFCLKDPWVGLFAISVLAGVARLLSGEHMTAKALLDGPRERLGTEEVRRVIASAETSIETECWAHDAGLHGEVRFEVTLKVDESGVVEDVTFAQHPAASHGLAHCVASKVRALHFSRSSEQATVKVPFVFGSH